MCLVIAHICDHSFPDIQATLLPQRLANSLGTRQLQQNARTGAHVPPMGQIPHVFALFGQCRPAATLTLTAEWQVLFVSGAGRLRLRC